MTTTDVGEGKGEGEVQELARFPVKSMLGEVHERLGFDARGALGDRLWAVRHADGKLGSGKSGPRFRRTVGLLTYRATYEDAAYEADTTLENATSPVPVVTTADGERLRADDPSASARIAELLGADVALVHEGEGEGEASHMDSGRVSLATTGSLRALGDLLGDEAPADVRRFRKNILVANDEPWAEDGWVGRELAVGPRLRLRVIRRIKRCVMTTMPQTGLPADHRVLKTLTAERGMCLGVYADVVAPGEVSVGDTVRLM